MKLLTVIVARSIWLFPIADWNPRGRSMIPVFFSLIERYKFLKYPGINEIDWVKGIKFEDGIFKTSAGEDINVTLTVYPDGVTADTRSSTQDSDEFLNTALSVLGTDFGYVPYETIIRKKVYLSEIHVRMEQPISRIHRGLAQFIQEASDALPDGNVSFGMGINISTDSTHPGTQLIFRLEPAAGFPFSENRYYSHAPFPTDIHLRLLDKFEATFLRTSA